MGTSVTSVLFWNYYPCLILTSAIMENETEERHYEGILYNTKS